MNDKETYIKSSQKLNEEDPLGKLKISLNQLLFSLKNKKSFPSTDIDIDTNTVEESDEDIKNLQDNEGENLLNQFENLNNINGNNSNISKENNNNEKKIILVNNNDIKNIKILLEKIRKIKEENLIFKNEIKHFKLFFEQMIQIVIEGAMMKENEINEKNKNNIKKLRKEIELSKQKINKIDISYKKKTNSDLQKFNKIISNNKIEKEQIEKNYKESIDNLEKEKKNLLEEKNKLYDDKENKINKLNKLNNDIIILEKEKQNIIQENNKLKFEINELDQKIMNIKKTNQENIETIVSEKDFLINQLSQELELANNKISNQSKEIEKSKLKIEELENLRKESKNILKQYEKEKIRINELEKIFNQFKNLKNENENTLKDFEKIKEEKIFLNKQNLAQKDLLVKYKNMYEGLCKEKEETKNNIDKLNKEINELKYTKNKLKIESHNIKIKDESTNKLRKIIENLKKQNKVLEEKNKELLKRLEIREKTGKVNKMLLGKERRHHKFENLYKINIESFIVKRKKNKRDKFNVPNNIEIITNRLYPKVFKTVPYSENKEKPIRKLK